MTEASEIVRLLAPSPVDYTYAPQRPRTSGQQPARSKLDTDRFRRAFDTAGIGMAIASADGLLLEVNQALCTMIGYTASELLGASLQSLTHPDDRKYDLEHVRGLLAGDIQTYQIEERYLHKDGRPVWTQLAVSLVRDDDVPLYFIAQVEDIEERKRVESQLIHQAFHDPLTSLPNRALFMDRLEHALARSQRSGEMVAVLFLDLDNFKLINDSLGHNAGDQLLVEIGERLRLCVRPGDTVARLGGDEFTVLLEHVTGVVDAVRVAERVAEQSLTFYSIDGRPVSVTASIGIAVSGEGAWAEDLVRNADTAMYEAKRRGRSCYEVFVPSMALDIRDRLELSIELQQAIARDELILEYQPVVELASGRVTGIDTHLGWTHPHRGMLMEKEFLPVAEETGLIVEIGRWMLDHACRQARRWRVIDPSLTIGVTLSTRLFVHPSLIDDIQAILRENDVAAEKLQLKIPEQAILENADTAIDTLRALKDLGVNLAINDFGEGFSSLSYLMRASVDSLRIGQGLVAGLGYDPASAAVVEAAVAVGRSLRLRVVACGVDTAEQHAMLQEMGCDASQGSYLGRPLMPDKVEEMLRDQNARHSTLHGSSLSDR